jgi:hypothetical protein
MRFDEFCRFQPHHKAVGDFEQEQFLPAFSGIFAFFQVALLT